MSSWSILAKEKYMKRHDRVCAELDPNMCKETGVQLEKEHWYEHVTRLTQKYLERKVNNVWNQQVKTDRTMMMTQ